MNSLRYLYDRQVRYIVAAVVLLIATIAPSIAMAAQVTERSIAMSSSTAGADGVTYNLKFTPAVGDATAGAFVLEFCSNSPLVGQTCSAPAGMDATSFSTTTPSLTLSGSNNKVVGTYAGMTSAAEVNVVIAGVNNPSAVGTFYARILTFTDATAANAYDAATPATYASRIGDGGVALSTTDKIGVSAAVLETLTFCVSKNAIADGCTGIDPVADAPVVKLGTVVGDVTVLDPSDVYEGSVNTQISTNAASGAIIRLKSNAADCGGLLRLGDAPGTCHIGPALALGINNGDALFGLKLGANDTDADGTIRAYDSGTGAYYNTTDLKLRYVDATDGVTSTYGDPILDTDGEPAQNKNMAITFGASVGNNTPAGLYSADLSLIATGRF